MKQVRNLPCRLILKFTQKQLVHLKKNETKNLIHWQLTPQFVKEMNTKDIEK